MYGQASSSRPPALPGPTEFDILKASHKFLREDDDARDASWEDRLAQKYYASLYREFAVCDLKHYKSGNFALRWRTESEVLSGAGEDTCGNTRCPLHDPSNSPSAGLKTVELPFVYEEHGERKSALVKVVLCDSCLKKLIWKREKEKKDLERRRIEEGERKEERNKMRDRDGKEVKEEILELQTEGEQEGRERSERKEQREEQSRKRKKSHSRSRSRSPSRKGKREHKDKHRRHDWSPS